MEQASAVPCNPPQPPPIFRLPPELILRILGFVALLGNPTDLSRLNRTCKTFHYHLSDPSRALDRTIWQSAASSILGLCAPVQTPLDPTWQAFVKRVWGLRDPSSIVPPDLEEEEPDEQAREERRIRSLLENEFVHTTCLGPFEHPPAALQHRKGRNERHFWHTTQDVISASLPPVPTGARRVLDFLHTGTEGTRSVVSGLAYCGSYGAFFVFADDPRGWQDSLSPAKGELRRGFVEVGDGAEGVVEGVRDLSEWTVESGLDEVRKGDTGGFAEWVRSAIHSDANLNIIPAMVKERRGSVAKPVLKKVVRYKMSSVVDKTWHLEGAKCWKDLGGGPWLDTDPHWEFCSAGDYLIVCDDNNGICESSIVCFSTASAPEPLWVKKMIGTTDAGEEYFYDNDGIKMNSAVVAYASRRQAFKDRRPQDLSMMKIFLLSTATGENVRTLLLPQESRPLRIGPGASNLYSWCSISLSESFAVASVGGNCFAEQGAEGRYNYREVFIWDLTNKSQDSPTHAIRLPIYAQNAQGVFTVLSQDGRFLGLHAGWKMEVWDLKKRAKVGVWKVKRGDLYDEEDDVLEPMNMNTSWNGLWIKWRDVYDVSPQTTSSTESGAASQSEQANQYPEPEKPGEPQAMKQKQEERSDTPGEFSLLPPSSTQFPLETHGMQYLTPRTLRRIFSRLSPTPASFIPENVRADIFSEDSSDDDSSFGAPFEEDDSEDSDFELEDDEIWDEVWDEADDYHAFGGDYEGDVGDNVGLSGMAELAGLMMGEFSHPGEWGAFGYPPAAASSEHGVEEGEEEGEGEDYGHSDNEGGGAGEGNWGDAMQGSPLPDWVLSAGHAMEPEDIYGD